MAYIHICVYMYMFIYVCVCLNMITCYIDLRLLCDSMCLCIHGIYIYIYIYLFIYLFIYTVSYIMCTHRQVFSWICRLIDRKTGR